jgi:tetratricopeptide (TPR) repeat protein
MKLLLFLFLVPVLSFAQLTDAETQNLQLIETYTKSTTTANYNDATKLSDALLQNHPTDSIVLLNRVRLYDAYVRKNKCNKYIVPKAENLCTQALNFYTSTKKQINYPRIALSIARVYFYQGDKANAKLYFEKALATNAFTDLEEEAIKGYLIQI